MSRGSTPLTREETTSILLGDLPGAGLPDLVYADGPNGVRGVAGATAFPSGLTLASSFDLGLAERFGEAVAREALAAGRNAMLAPGLDIARVPRAGRIAESLGEDPLLTGEIGGTIAAAFQRSGVLSVPKHFVANNFEYLRTGRGSLERRSAAIDVRVSRRALLELYAEPFRRVLVKYRAAGLLSSYNRINGEYASESAAILRLPFEEWGWRGVIVPDFIFAVRDDERALLAGLHLPALGGMAGRSREMVEGAPAELTDRLAEDVADAMTRAGVHPASPSTEPLDDRASQELAREMLEAGSVLLKNDGLLPLDLAAASSLALPGIEDPAHLLVMGGSAAVTLSPGRIEPLAAPLTRLLGDGAVTVVGGTLGDVPLPTLTVEVIATVRDAITGREQTLTLPEFAMPDPPAGVGADWSATLSCSFTPTESGDHRLALTFAGDARLRVDGIEVAEGYREASPMIAGPDYPLQAIVPLEAGRVVTLLVEFDSGSAITIPPLGIRPGFELGLLGPGDTIQRAAEAARAADVAVVVVGRVSGEAMDVDSLRLPGDQERLVEAVAAVNPRTVVVTCGGGPVLMPWADRVAAILHVWNPGERFAEALTRLLFGLAEPGGRLPLTFAACEERTPVSSPDRYPGLDGVVRYEEELLVGYRWYDAIGEEPAFPFGHGLGYTTFELHELTVTEAGGQVTGTVLARNTGSRAGKVVVQLYTSSPEPAGHPPRSLRAFGTRRLEPGESTVVPFAFPVADLAAYDEIGGRWVLHGGRYGVEAGLSSRDLHARTELPVEGRILQPSDR
ncbi:beta-glucosidase [Lysobacter korlensis]|uniref:Beta-glucosidase n=1 Tax=Lysobacter korlensis TaxID=553636 RepID=A0ABV6RP39_9GAMM